MKVLPKQNTPELRSSKELAKQIAGGDLADSEIQSLSPLSILCAVNQLGIESLADLTSSISHSQYQIMLDLLSWREDTISEDAIFFWLNLVDSPSDLEPLAKFIKCFDFEALELLIKRNTEVYVPDEGDDAPPGKGWYSPDNGRLWLQITCENETKKKMIGKLLAMLFQSNAPLFYQLMTAYSAATTTELEEHCYKKHTQRLEKAGFPSTENAYSFHKSISNKEIREIIGEKVTAPSTILISSDLIFVSKQNNLFDKLVELCQKENLLDEIQETFCSILNASLIVHRVELMEENSIVEHISKVKGCINLGLELVQDKIEIDYQTFRNFPTLTLIAYRVGYNEIIKLRKQSLSLLKSGADSRLSHSESLFLHATANNFPFFLSPIEDLKAENIDSKTLNKTPITSKRDLTSIKNIVDNFIAKA